MFIKFAEIDLKKPIQPIFVAPRYNCLFVVVFWGYLPLGMVKVETLPRSGLVTAHQLKDEIYQALGWRLWELGVAGLLSGLEEMDDSVLLPVSVVVCTRDRALSLGRCLAALKKLDYPDYEVAVIDNCSKDPAVAQVIKESGFRYVREDRPGLDWARNRGWKEASHDLIAYIDDDALAMPGWLRGFAFAFQNPAVMAVTGMVLPAEIETQAQSDFERYGGMSKGFYGNTVSLQELNQQSKFWASGWGVGANMAFRRSLFEAVGGFDVALDVGTPTSGAGDLEFFYRVVDAGFLLRYEPAAAVFHVHRRDRASLMRQIYNNGRSFPAYLLTIARRNPQQRFQVFTFMLRYWMWGWILRRLLAGFIKRDGEALRLALTELRGAFSAWGAYRQSQKVAAQIQRGESG